MLDALIVHRLHFAFTVTFHYLFPQLTMGLALLIVILKTMALRTGEEHYNRAARFWMKIFAINFAMGVVTGIPMEFQFGTNWAQFSRAAGGVIGQTLAMEGIFSFFLESSFLGLFLFGEKRLGPKGHWFAAFMVFLGSWLSGYLIIATDAWMQRPVAYTMGPNGEIMLTSFWGLLLNHWALWQYVHNMSGAVITAAFVMAALGAFYLLIGKHPPYGQTFVRVGVIVGIIATIFQLFPSGDGQGRMLARHQPVTLAAMEGLFYTQRGAPVAIIGQPDMDNKRLDNPLLVPRMLSFLTYRRWMSEVKGLDAFPQPDWPDNIPLLYYSYHVMVGLGTIFIAIMVVCAWKLWKRDFVHLTRNALGSDALASLPLHCQYGRMDDGRGGTPTMGHLWSDAHGGGDIAASVFGKRLVYPARVHGDVRGAWHPVPLPGLPRGRAGAGSLLKDRGPGLGTRGSGSKTG